MLPIDPLRLARRQLEHDRERCRRFPHLHPHKIERMSASPLAFLRGSAPLFYELLAERPSLAEGPRGTGWLCGDMHLENFGAYHPDALTRGEKAGGGDSRAVFNLNDFDDAIVGPWRFDVLRLVASVILGGRELGADGRRALDLSYELVDTYAKTVFGGARLPRMPPPVAALVEKVRSRSRKELLDARTELVRGARRFVRGPRYRDVAAKLRKKGERAFLKYAKRLPDGERPSREQLEILDVAFRVAGTGSLGSLRMAVLVRGKGGPDGAWIFDMKEEGVPSAAVLRSPPTLAPAERVVTALRSCLEHPPKMIGRTRIGGMSLFVRRLAPQEDKLDLGRMRSEDLEGLARYLGALLGAAHRRGATKPPGEAWRRRERELLVDHAITIAGVHEATYLALCRLTR